jgi:radical SAM superfamily enzyme YgiQ (UPF0313 family)
MNKKKIVLVNPPVRALKEMKIVPEGLCLLSAAILRDLKDYEVKIIDAQAQDYSLEETVKKVVDYGPDYLGISVSILSVSSASEIASAVKKTMDLPVIIGGPQVTLMPEEVMKRYLCFDYGVIGEGEITLINLLRELDKRKKKLGKINGIIYRSGSRLVRTRPAKLINDLDSLPLPAWGLLENKETYSISISRSWRFPAFSFLSSRGCPGQCIFCAKLYGNCLRSYSSERLIKVVGYLMKNYGIKHIDFYDDNFVIFRERLKKFCGYIIENDIDITWTCLSRVDHINEEILKLMYNAGCRKLEFGIESGNQKILDFERKGITLEQIRRAVEMTKEAKIEAAGFVILGHPNETKETMKETIDFVKSLWLNDCFFSYMTPYPGTELYKIAKKYGKFKEDWSIMNQGSISFIPRGLTENDLREYYKKGMIEFYFRPRIIFHYLTKSIRQKKILDLFRQGFQFLSYIKKGTAN